MSDVINMPEPQSATWAGAQLAKPLEELVQSALADEAVQEALRDPALSSEDLSAEILKRRDELLRAPSSELRRLSAATHELRALIAQPTPARLIVSLPFGINLVLYPDRTLEWVARVLRRLTGIFVVLEDGDDSAHSQSSDLSVNAAQAEVDVARRAYTDAVFEKGVRRLLRSLIEELTESSYSTSLDIQSAPDLAELTREEPGLSTSRAELLQQKIRGMGGGSIGISGPRGIGKTTLLEAIVLDDRPREARRQPLSLLVSAPVAYDGRDFVLHLFAELCQRLLESAGVSGFDLERGAPEDEVSFWLRLLVVVQALALGAAFTGVAVLLVDALVPNDARRQAFLVGCIVLSGSVGVLLGLFVSLALRRRRRRRAGLVDQALGFLGLLGLPVGSVLIVLAVLGDHLSTTTQRAALVALLGLSTMVLALRTSWLIVWGEQDGSGDGDDLDLALHSGDPMVPIAYAWRDRIRFQQRYTTGWSGGLIAPFGLEATRSGRKDATEQQITFPAAVAALRRFIEQAASGRDVVIAIDELDKMESSDIANRFLNEIKAIFRIEHCFYLVSVSEDAMSQFERRGMPLRDVFDSSFDEVLYLEYLTVGESRQLLGERVIGLPAPFLFLAHCMSAGLPRDLIRVTRELIDASLRQGGPVSLGEVCKQAVHLELSRKTRATTVAVRGIGLEPHASNFLRWMDRLAQPIESPQDLLDRCATVESFIAVDLPALDDNSTRGDRHCLERSQLIELTLELTLVAYFSATLLDFFKDTLTRSELRSVEQGPQGEPPIELLARARQSFGVNRQIAWSLISRFREWAPLLDSLSFPSVASANDNAREYGRMGGEQGNGQLEPPIQTSHMARGRGSPMRHEPGLEDSPEEKQECGEHEGADTLVGPERSLALDDPAGAADGEPGPLER